MTPWPVFWTELAQMLIWMLAFGVTLLGVMWGWLALGRRQ